MRLSIFVPLRDDAVRTIAPKSAVVGPLPPADADRVLCHYEGNLHGAANLQTYFDRLVVAVGRCRSDYPTRARSAFRRADLVEVGILDAVRFVVLEVTRAMLLEAWSGETVAEIAGVRLDPGVCGWDAAVEAARGATPLVRAAEDWFVKTRAGQVVLLEIEARSGRIFDHDDPELKRRLSGRLSPDLSASVFGDEP